MPLKNIHTLIVCLTLLVAFGLYEWLDGRVYTEYVYVKVPTVGMKMSSYEAGCLSALTRVGAINAENRIKLITAGIK